ncbi:MAG: pilus assembly FimT family protein, partial [Pseudolabrys sp.]
MVRTVRKAAPVRPLISAAGCAERADCEGGFTIIEVVCVLAIIALVAAILLPEVPHGTSRSRLAAYALEIAVVLKTDRTAAIERHTAIATDIDALGRSVRAGASSRAIRVPADVRFDAALAARCNQREAGSTITFFASGMSCGGVIALTRLGVGYQ